MSTTGDAPLNLTKPSPADTINLGILNSNYDAINSHASTADGRLDSIETTDAVQDSRLTAIEANNWVTNARIADGAVGAAELASTLDLTTKTVSVAAPSVDAHAATKKYVDDTASPAAWASYTATLSGGAASAFSVNSSLYGRSGKTVFVRGVVLCTGTPAGGTLSITLPVEAKAPYIIFSGMAQASYPVFGTVSTTAGVSTLTFKVMTTSATYGTIANIAASVPAAWVADQNLTFALAYEGI